MNSSAFDPHELIRFITWYASTRGERLTTIRLVKFLYLADLFFARERSGQTLTGWLWAFVHYGPFCTEALHAIRTAREHGLVDAQPYPSQYDEKDYWLYGADPYEQEPSIVEQLPAYVVSELKEAIRKWADDTPGLLDYVYFHTEPMMIAVPGNRLDFSLAVKYDVRPIPMRPLTREQLRRGRQAIGALKEKLRRGAEHLREVERSAIYDEHYDAGLRALDGLELDGGLSGTADLSKIE